MLKTFALAASLTLFFGPVAHAKPVTITQIFKNVTWNDGSLGSPGSALLTATGDWIFKGSIDTDSPNLYPWPYYGGSYAASVTLTQASLGLFDERITNLNYAHFSFSVFTFDTSPNYGDVFTAIRYFGELTGFPSIPLDDFIAHPISLYAGSGFTPQTTGFIFADGRLLHGMGMAESAEVYVDVSSPVPEPASVFLILAGLGAIAVSARRRSK
ncbi:MAG TPA: PEP-CTERM sorting domain-containing protein [Telluria sp.]|jgi:hypothetical protein